jgi:hypothetical protein
VKTPDAGCRDILSNEGVVNGERRNGATLSRKVRGDLDRQDRFAVSRGRLTTAARSRDDGRDRSEVLG